MKKMIYFFESETKEFLYAAPAERDPKNPDNYLTYITGTDIPPPDFGENQKPVWNGENWDIVPDYRQTTWYYRKEDGTIGQQDIPLKNGLGIDKVLGGVERISDLPKTQEEKERAIRSKRDSLLEEADILILRYLERGETPSEELKEYRQALRDIPEQEGFPDNVVWPDKP